MQAVRDLTNPPSPPPAFQSIFSNVCARAYFVASSLHPPSLCIPFFPPHTSTQPPFDPKCFIIRCLCTTHVLSVVFFFLPFFLKVLCSLYQPQYVGARPNSTWSLLLGLCSRQRACRAHNHNRVYAAVNRELRIWQRKFAITACDDDTPPLRCLYIWDRI